MSHLRHSLPYHTRTSIASDPEDRPDITVKRIVAYTGKQAPNELDLYRNEEAKDRFISNAKRGQ